MATRDPAVVGGLARKAPASEQSTAERWTVRKAGLMAISGACLLWCIVLGAMTLIGG